MKNSTIGVLLPVYKKDVPHYFIQALNSVLNQTHTDINVLIGVDGPVFGDLANTLESIKDERIKIIYFKENRGLACVLNDLISEARSLDCQWLARMDADDICMPTRFQKQYDFLQLYPDVDVVGGQIEEIDGRGNKTGKVVQYPLTHDDCRKFFRYRDPLAHPATFFRIRYFEKAKGYRPEYRKNQDTMLWYDGFMNGCVFANLPETVLQFRVASDFYSRRNGWKRAKQMMTDRIKINKTLGYDISANIFAIFMFCMTLSPTFIKKILYKIR